MRFNFTYTKARLLVLLVAIGITIGGVVLCNHATFRDVEYTRFTINEEMVKEYGYFENISLKTKIQGLILEPTNNRYSDNDLRPCVFYFHGMFARKEYHLHHAMYLARAGFVVIMVDHAGQGGSMGTYRLGLECEAIGLTVVDWLFQHGNETFNLRVNASQIGATGHSYGGITTAFLGINRPDVIKACVSVWTWSNLTRTMGKILGVPPESMFQESIWDLLSITGFPLALMTNASGQNTTEWDDYQTFYNNIAERDALPRVDLEIPRPPNWLLITAFEDSLTTPNEQVDIVANASYTPFNEAGWQYGQFRNWVYNNATGNGYWDNLDESLPATLRGDFATKSARALYLPKGNEPQPHIIEGMRADGIIMGLEWFGRAFSWDVEYAVAQIQETEINFADTPYALPRDGLMRYVGLFLMLLGLHVALFPVLSFALRYRRTEEKYQVYQVTPIFPEQETAGLAIKIVAVCAATFGFWIIAPLVALELGFNGPAIGIPYIIYDGFTAILLARAMFLAPFVFLFYLAMRRRSQLQWSEVGVEKNNVPMDILIGGGFALVLIFVFDVLAYATIFPLIWPTESPAYGFMGSYLFLAYFALFGFLDEILLRGIVQGGIERAAYRAPKIKSASAKKWIAYICSVLISMGVNFVGGMIGIFVLLGRVPQELLVNLVFLPLLFYCFMTSVVNSFLYQRTKSVVPGMAFTMIFFAFFFSANIMGAITF